MRREESGHKSYIEVEHPLRQNYRHVRALADLLGIQPDKILPVIVFWGDCQFRTTMPPNVLANGFAGYIKSKRLVRFDDDEAKQIVAPLKERMLSETWDVCRRSAEM
jgi:restriction system protein